MDGYFLIKLIDGYKHSLFLECIGRLTVKSKLFKF